MPNPIYMNTSFSHAVQAAETKNWFVVKYSHKYNSEIVVFNPFMRLKRKRKKIAAEIQGRQQKPYKVLFR